MMPAQPNQSLIDGLAVLQAIAGRDGAVGGRELARDLGLEPTRTNRLLKTLAALGLALQGEDRRYRPGPGVHVLAAQALHGSGLLRRAVPHLERLHRHGLTVALGVLWREHVSYLYHAQPGMAAADAIGRAGLYPAVESGIGMALLAAHGDLRQHPTRRGQLQRIRRDGYAFVATQHRGHHSLGVALPDASGAGIALAGRISATRVPALVADLIAAARACAEGVRGEGLGTRA